MGDIDSNSINTIRKNNAVFMYYKKILKKYGDVAKYVPKNVLYREVGLPFYLGSRRTSAIIHDKLKYGAGTELEQTTKEDLERTLKAFKEVEA